MFVDYLIAGDSDLADWPLVGFHENKRGRGALMLEPADPAGRLVWISSGLPGSVHDLTAAVSCLAGFTTRAR